MTSQGTSRFELAPEYRELPRRPVLGQVFEERPSYQWKQAQRVPQWFSNLLPEQKLRDLIAEKHGISPRNEFRLLMALGTDLPGAVEVVAADRAMPRPVKGVVNGETSEGEGAGIAKAQDDDSSEGAKYLLRFSLAGVQLKLSMMLSGNTLMLPGVGGLGGHLVKLPSRHYAGLLENEFSMMTWAREIGISVPECEIRPAEDVGPLPPGFDTLGGATVYVVRRFDRIPDAAAQDERIHMEDLNQVVGNWPEDKYKGANFERLGRIIRTLCGEDDFLEYVRRLTFCIGIGNEDAHLKNWTVWYPNRIQPRLSPAYDLVSTIQYPELDRTMALNLGRERNASRVNLTTMERLAKGTDVDPNHITQTVQQTLEKMRDSWQLISTDLPIGKSFHDQLRNYQKSVPLLRPFVI